MSKAPQRPAKTNAVRVLDREQVSYVIHRYDPAIKTAQGVASALDVPHHAVYKTLVLVAEPGRMLLVMVPGDSEVDRKLLASQIGVKAVRMATKEEAERVTGLKTGGIGALALTAKSFAVYIDRRARSLDRIFVNGGERGVNVEMAPEDLIRVSGATPVETSLSA